MDASETSPSGPVRGTFFVHGYVQGVGFRWWVRARALELGLVGHARNTVDGRVEVVAQGPAESVDRLQALLTEVPSTTRRPGRVTQVVSQRGAAKDGVTSFEER
jgi:acylphosphatase